MILWFYDTETPVAYSHRYLMKRKLKAAYHAAARTVRTIFTGPAPCLDPSSTLSRAALPWPPACPKHVRGAQQMLVAVPARREIRRQRIYLLSRQDLPQNLPHLHKSETKLYREIFYTKSLSLLIKHGTNNCHASPECLNIWVGFFRLQLGGWSICLLYSVTLHIPCNAATRFSCSNVRKIANYFIKSSCGYLSVAVNQTEGKH